MAWYKARLVIRYALVVIRSTLKIFFYEIKHSLTSTNIFAGIHFYMNKTNMIGNV